MWKKTPGIMTQKKLEWKYMILKENRYQINQQGNQF